MIKSPFRPLFAGILFSLVLTPDLQAEKNAVIGPFVDWFLENGEKMESVRFAEVVEAASDKEMLPVQRDQAPDAFMLASLQTVTESMLLAFKHSEHPVHEEGRINEVSRHIEDFMLEHLNAVEGLECSIPVNAVGDHQRSGYPDLRLEHTDSGRVFYLDPKVYKLTSEGSSFRTFYFEPKGATNKILDDASHLILGLGHGGKEGGRWQFLSWKLVDLIDFRVRLKAEFQASNRQLYREAAVLLRSPSAAEK